MNVMPDINDFWKPDILGNGFEMHTAKHPADYSGPVCSTVVRLLSANASTRSVLYIHGFSDYFFQKEMAHKFTEHGYNFYAVDLRKYGRSHMPWQKFFQVKSLSEYFPDIDNAVETIKADGSTEIILLGHSTGGLTASLYMQAKPEKCIKALILNSPFLAWNLPWPLVKIGIPVICALSKVFPGLKLRADKTDNYASGIARHLGGEWDYRTDFKPDVLPPVDATWIRAISQGQRKAAEGNIKVPILLLHSDKSAHAGDAREAFKKSDGVLDVDKISAAGQKLGPDVTDITIPDGLHDLVLSRPDVRDKVYSTIFAWLTASGL